MEHIKTYRDLYELLKHDFGDRKSAIEKVLALQPKRMSPSFKKSLSKKIGKFVDTVREKKKRCNYTESRFFSMNTNWLDSNIKWFDEDTCDDTILDPSPSTSKSPSSSMKEFEQLSDRQKRRRTEDLQSSPPEYINYIASKNLKDPDAKFVYEFIRNHPHLSSQIRKYCENLLPNKPYSLSNSDSLKLYLNADLNKQSYSVLRSTVNQIVPNVFPSYYKIQESKQECYPNQEALTVSEVHARLQLQSILDKTASRLIELIGINSSEKRNLTLLAKWGCDGSSGHSRYKQTFSDPLFDDSSIFTCSFVPLKLYEEATGNDVWKNPAPSSSRFCRPISFRFEKENKALTNNCMREVNEEIAKLVAFQQDEITVNYKLCFTMVDTKICNDVTENASSMKCYICKATPKTMNNLVSITSRESNSDYYSFGISSLHAWIRCFECLLHISYKIPFASWSARGENKSISETRKRNIQDLFRSKLGLLVDIVKQGSGTTNDGNTARKFFLNYKISAEITGLDVRLIKKFYVILQLLTSSSIKINFDAFQAYTRDTAELYVSLYGWYYMPVTVHKILMHGTNILKYYSIVPIGMLSEDAQESNHKIMRYVRLHHTRKLSREKCNMDLMHTMLLLSDPIMSSNINRYSKKLKILIDAKPIIQSCDVSIEYIEDEL